MCLDSGGPVGGVGMQGVEECFVNSGREVSYYRGNNVPFVWFGAGSIVGKMDLRVDMSSVEELDVDL